MAVYDPSFRRAVRPDSLDSGLGHVLWVSAIKSLKTRSAIVGLVDLNAIPNRFYVPCDVWFATIGRRPANVRERVRWVPLKVESARS